MRSQGRRAATRVVITAIAVAAFFAGGALAASPAPVRVETPHRLSFLGEVSWPAGRLVRLEPEGVPIGGLSGLTWVAEEGVFLAVSDDPGTFGPPRYYTLRVDLEDGHLSAQGVEVESVTLLTEVAGRPFLPSGIDAEGLEITPTGRLLISSEGNLRRGVEPFLAEFERDGGMRRRIALEERLRPTDDGSAGPRHNLVFESLSLTPDGRFLFTATESALIQDGPVADLERGSPVRLLRYEMAPGAGRDVAPEADRWPRKRPEEYLYLVDPVRRAPEPADAFGVNGLVELVALDHERLLALERSYSSGVGNAVRLYLVSLAEATEISGVASLMREPSAGLVAASKELLLDFEDLGIELDNLEGMALGPLLDDGRRTLVVIGDDNFNVGIQRTQILAFAMAAEAASVAAIQGRSHRSPLEGDWVRGIGGVVTAVANSDESSAFWMLDIEGDADPGTSDGIYVERPPGETPVEVGDRVSVSGRVRESGRPGELSVTTLEATRVVKLAAGHPPPAVTIGEAGRRPPTEIVDDDGLEHYDPESDGVDFYESLEGMPVEVADPLVVSPTRSWGELVVTPDGGRHATSRTAVGGLLVAAGDENPERLVVSTRLLDEAAPQVAVGDRLAAPLEGVMHYDRGIYKLLAVQPLPDVRPRPSLGEPTKRKTRRRELTIATFNVQNLDPGDPQEKLAGLAEIVVRHLHSPAVLALQEVQDASGSEDDGVVSAEATLERLAASILAAGGPAYASVQIDPEDGADGGQPGGNIRVAYLLDPTRVSLTRRTGSNPRTPVEILPGVKGPTLEPNPGLIAPGAPAFAGDVSQGFAGARKSLALELEFRGERIFLVNNHLKSKRGDDATFGSRQPPLRITEHQRSRQAAVLRDFAGDLLARDPGAFVVVLGDMNDVAWRAPLAVLEGTVLVSLMDQIPAESRYSFNYRGNSQLIDHILVSPGLAERASIDLEIVHVSSDRPDSRRFTDHDPVLARLTFGR